MSGFEVILILILIRILLPVEVLLCLGESMRQRESYF